MIKQISVNSYIYVFDRLLAPSNKRKISLAEHSEKKSISYITDKQHKRTNLKKCLKHLALKFI